MQINRISKNDYVKNYPCIWMQSGVVKKKYCRTEYDCPSCRYDKILFNLAWENRNRQKEGVPPSGKRGNIVYWKDNIMQRTSSPFSRPCIHSMKQRINFRPCFDDYQCASCEFDQFFTDEFTVHTVAQPVDVMNIKGIKMPQGFYLHEGHTWLKIEEEGEVRIGFDDFITRVLGPLDKIEAPLIGQVVKRNRPDIRLKRGTCKANVRSPISGVVTSVNVELLRQPRLAAQSPYADGWVMRVHPKNLRKDLKNMVIGEQAKKFVSHEVEKIIGLIEEYSGPLAADGGELASDIFGCVPEIGWERLTKAFLRS
ncbi:MAG: glycine cleavage system protein H [Desulfobacterales bacterium]